MSSTLVPVGLLSDFIGRKMIFIITLVILASACLGFILAKSIDELYVYMFMMGCTFPGRMIVGMNYAYEFQVEKWKEYI